MAASSTADDILMATPKKAPIDTSDKMFVASPKAETVSGTNDDDNTADDATSKQEKEVPPLMVRICSHTESENRSHYTNLMTTYTDWLVPEETHVWFAFPHALLYPECGWQALFSKG